jgi:hypothetical protein
MSAEDSQPGPLAAQALALQAQQQEADEATHRAFACLLDRPEEAFRLLAEAREKWDASFRDQEAWLRQQLGQWEQIPQQIQELRQAAVQQSVSLLYGQGQAGYLSGNLAEARAAFEEGLSLLGDQPGVDRAMLLLALANVDAQAGWQGQQNAIEAGETPYGRAYRECLAVERIDQVPVE